MVDYDTLFRNGIVASWYLREDQMDVYELLVNQRYPFLECSRRYGKTTSILVYVEEMLRKNPGWVCRWCEPWRAQAREIVIPEMTKIQSYVSKGLRAEYIGLDSFYRYPNGSKMYLRGINNDGGESARGPFANIIVADEYGTWKKAEYVRKDILNPQLLTTRGKFIYASTPPKDLGHSYYDHKIVAQKKDRYVCKTIYDNKSLTQEDIEGVIEESGGLDSTTFRREYMCEPVSDEKALVIPEFRKDVHALPQGQVSDYCDFYTVGDFGWADHTSILFAYYDFIRAKIIVMDEVWESGRNSSEISKLVKQKEKELYQGKEPHKRGADATDQQLYDLNTQEKLIFLKVDNRDKFAGINQVRRMFQDGRIEINQRCKALIFQLEVGMWNDKRTDFERGEKTGHLDSIMALVYLVRTVDTTKNPYPRAHDAMIGFNMFNNAPSDEGSALAAAIFGNKKTRGF